MADLPIIQPKNLPPAHLTREPPPLPQVGAFWAARQGDDLIVQSGAPLPDVCVKCGKRGGNSLRYQNFVWTPRWVYLLVFVNLIVVAIVAMVMQKKGRLALPLCPSCKSRWSMANLFLGLSITWIFVGLILGGVLLANDVAALGALTMISAIAAPIAVSVALVKPRTIRPKIIKDLLLTLNGFHPDAADAIVAATRPAAAQLPAAAAGGDIALPR
jgi:hypothetical protein